MDTYEIVEGLKSTDYIVWPSEDCKKGMTVYKNEGMSYPTGDMGVDDMGMDGGMSVMPEEGMEPETEDGL